MSAVFVLYSVSLVALSCNVAIDILTSIVFLHSILIINLALSAIVWIAKFDPELPKESPDDKIISSIVENE